MFVHSYFNEEMHFICRDMFHTLHLTFDISLFAQRINWKMTIKGSIYLGISGNNYTFHLTGSQTWFAQNEIMSELLVYELSKFLLKWSEAQLDANRSE